MDSFVCDKCQGTFNKAWTEAEAKREFEHAAWNIPGDTIATLCDLCFGEFKKCFANLTEEVHKKLRDEFRHTQDD